MSEKNIDLQEETEESTDLANAGLTINAQYLKDLSFENPAPIDNLIRQDGEVSTNINIEVGVNPLQEDVFEVVLAIKAHVVREDQTIYLVEMIYAGIFTLSGIPEEMIQLVLFVECPRLLFPFARNLVTQVTQESGFPPLYLKPVDFAGLLKQKLDEVEEAEESDVGHA